MVYTQVSNPDPSQQASSSPSQSFQSSNPLTPGMAIPIPHGSTPLRILEYVLIIAIIAVASVYLYVTFFNVPKPSTTTTTVPPVQRNTSGAYSLSQCTPILSPGSYELSSNIKYFNNKGACISIQSDNVNLKCSGKGIFGSGPFDSLAPYSYGIYAANVVNVTINGCSVSNFSYGIAGISSSKLSISGSDMQSNYMSDIYLNNTTYSRIRSNHLSKSLSAEGSLFLANGSEHDIVDNNTMLFNQLFAINVSANNDSFYNNTMNSTPQYSFYCSVYDSFPSSSAAVNNICSNNNGCGFVNCKGANIPANIPSITLAKQVNTCGSITTPGSYDLGRNLYMDTFINITNSRTINGSIPCIGIEADDVSLNCAGNGIYNSTYAIVADNVSNFTLSNCKISGASFIGVSISKAYNSTIKNVSVSYSSNGIYINSSYASALSDVALFHNVYGLTFSNSKTNTVSGANAINNTYGIYTELGSIGNNFYNIIAKGNSNLDVYSDFSTQTRQDNLMQSSSCYKTNADWASCTLHVSPNLGYTPVTSCTGINAPGNYTLTQDILTASPDCITINASNVRLDCANYQITGNIQSQGYGIGIFNESNVLVKRCSVSRFKDGIIAYNATALNLENSSSNTSSSGFLLYNLTSGTVSNSNVKFASDYAFLLSGVRYSAFSHDSSSSGIGTSTGLELANSTGNLVINNNMQEGAYGIVISGMSRNNTISNNTASLSSKYDFACYGNSAIGAENGGINYGTTKLGCTWLAALNKGGTEPSCSSSHEPAIYNLLSDYVYGYGSICFTITGNDTTINCNGHTIIASDGGTFVQFNHSYGSIIENCNLVNFTSPVESTGSDISVINNTFVDSALSNIPAVNITGGIRGSIVTKNNVTAHETAIRLIDAPYSTVSHNIIYDAALAYSIIMDSGVSFTNNVALHSTYNGTLFNGTSGGTVQDNNLSSSGTALTCTGTSASRGGMVDLGGNLCSRQSGCAWITGSSVSC